MILEGLHFPSSTEDTSEYDTDLSEKRTPLPVDNIGHASVDVEEELEDLQSVTPNFERGIIPSIIEVSFNEESEGHNMDTRENFATEKSLLDRGVVNNYISNISTHSNTDASNNVANNVRGSTNAQVSSGLNISKAAARMRKYRFDHKNDVEWLSKESIRKRITRAKRKRENMNDILVHNSVAEKTKTEVDLVEYNRKEAERARRYRAVKRLDPVWKERDAARMRVWRAKRRADSGAALDCDGLVVTGNSVVRRSPGTSHKLENARVISASI